MSSNQAVAHSGPRRWLARFAPKTGWAALALVLAFLALMPLVQLQYRALSDGASAYGRMLDLHAIGQTITTTLQLAAGSVVIALTLGTGLAWCSLRVSSRMRRVVGMVPFIPLVIPSIANIIGWSFLLAPRVGYINTMLRDTWMFSHLETGPIDIYSSTWIIIITGFTLTSFVYLFVSASLRAIGVSFEAAARVNGASQWRAFFFVTLPLLRPALVYSGSIVSLMAIGQFAAPLLLGRARGIDVVTTEMFKLSQGYPIDYGLGAALASPIVVAAIGLLLFQKRLLGASEKYIVRSGKNVERAAESTWWASIPIAAYGLVAVVLPVAALVHVALSPYWSGELTLSGLGLSNLQAVLFDNAQTRLAVVNSVKAAGLAALIVIPLTYFAAFCNVGYANVGPVLRRVLDFLTMIPLTIPAAIFGFGVLFSYSGSPFNLYGSLSIIVVAYVTLMLPHAFRGQLNSMTQLGRDFWEAARVSGAGSLRAQARVLVPLVRPGIASAASIVTVLLFHEFAASSMVRSARTQVMSTVLYDYWNAGTYPQVAAMALVMVVVTAIGVSITMLLGSSRQRA